MAACCSRVRRPYPFADGRCQGPTSAQDAGSTWLETGCGHPGLAPGGLPGQPTERHPAAAPGPAPRRPSGPGRMNLSEGRIAPAYTLSTCCASSDTNFANSRADVRPLAVHELPGATHPPPSGCRRRPGRPVPPTSAGAWPGAAPALIWGRDVLDGPPGSHTRRSLSGLTPARTDSKLPPHSIHPDG